ncbi:hypothetical protein [Sporosarcina limicola]|uniref:Uncharacterized protein n=1 Tax=Sporosarcina limicola TaxID=34101 RepID=A0A927MH31_9BACL|nr:hypothetical protein [Sporosarcina limicola]MBE1554569.1 hypothetical protein [Sporosarcina limicola]
MRVMKMPFRTGKLMFERLFECNRVAGEIWNRCLDLAKDTDNPEEKSRQKTEVESMKMMVLFDTFYHPNLVNLQPEASKNDAPLLARKNNPTPFNSGIENRGA